MKKIVNIVGQKFGRLTVIERVEDSKRGNSRWKCRCDCGNETIVLGYHLTSGNTKSCGCYQKEKASKCHSTHGIPISHPIYCSWHNLKARCLNENDPDYGRYGGRGITISDEWKDNFMAFYTWAITHGWQEGLTIDRIDNNGNYCRENCRWVDMTTQNNNKVNNVWLEFNGEKHTLPEWARTIGVDTETLRKRLSQCGWTVEKALTTPTMKKYHHKEVVS